MEQQQPKGDAIPWDAPQKLDTMLDAIVPLESDSALTETVPMTFSIDLENNNLGNAAFETTCLEGTSLSSTSLEKPPFGSSSVVSIDMSSVGGLDTSPNIVMSNQNSSRDWLDNNPVLSPSLTTPQSSYSDWLDNNPVLSRSATTSGPQQVLVSKKIQPLSGSTISDLMQIDLYVFSILSHLALSQFLTSLLWAFPLSTV